MIICISYSLLSLLVKPLRSYIVTCTLIFIPLHIQLCDLPNQWNKGPHDTLEGIVTFLIVTTQLYNITAIHTHFSKLTLILSHLIIISVTALHCYQFLYQRMHLLPA